MFHIKAADGKELPAIMQWMMNFSAYGKSLSARLLICSAQSFHVRCQVISASPHPSKKIQKKSQSSTPKNPNPPSKKNHPVGSYAFQLASFCPQLQQCLDTNSLLRIIELLDQFWSFQGKKESRKAILEVLCAKRDRIPVLPPAKYKIKEEGHPRTHSQRMPRSQPPPPGFIGKWRQNQG
jgi:hypothetical protein